MGFVPRAEKFLTVTDCLFMFFFVNGGDKKQITNVQRGIKGVGEAFTGKICPAGKIFRVFVKVKFRRKTCNDSAPCIPSVGFGFRQFKTVQKMCFIIGFFASGFQKFQNGTHIVGIFL